MLYESQKGFYPFSKYCNILLGRYLRIVFLGLNLKLKFEILAQLEKWMSTICLCGFDCNVAGIKLIKVNSYSLHTGAVNCVYSTLCYTIYTKLITIET